MFRQQGPGRTDRQNGILAAYLALVAGFVNSASFVLIGMFTSHVTGNVGRFANDLVTRQGGAAAGMIAAFFVGAFIASMIIESNVAGRTAISYGFALGAEALVLLAFILSDRLHIVPQRRAYDVQGGLLCVAMGAQNSLVTRLSGAIVRTTHLTGVVTDLGIEAARWFRFWRSRLSSAVHVRLAFGRARIERPPVAKVRLLATIVGAFALGSVLGAEASRQLHRDAFWFPCVAILLSAVYAFSSSRRPEEVPSMSANP